jgi:hypothetical protein
MAFKDLFKKKYNQNVWCNNCNSHSEVSIPKGVTLTQYVESGACPNCGCITLVAGYKQIDEFKQSPDPPTELKPKPKIKFFYKPLKQKPENQHPQRMPQRIPQRTSPPVQRAPTPTPQPQRAQLPQPRPSNRPANLPPPVERRPIPDFTPKGVYTNEIDFWTGTKKRGDYYENS